MNLSIFAQCQLNVCAMKLLLLLNIIFVLNFSSCFILYPFTSDSWLDPFLDIVNEKILSENHESAKKFNKIESDWSMGKDCNRECIEDDPKICRFNFMMKYFQVMGG